MRSEAYRRAICIGLKTAVLVPYVHVSIGDWQPRVGDCHNNVDHWVREKPGDSPVRGWVTFGTDGGTKILLTLHSVVRGADGRLFDITPLGNEVVRGTMFFVPHTESEDDFARLIDSRRNTLECDTGSAQ